MVKSPLVNAGGTKDMSLIPGQGIAPRKGNSNQSNIFAWETPWTEEPGGLQSM